jgi:predicted porin
VSRSNPSKYPVRVRESIAVSQPRPTAQVEARGVPHCIRTLAGLMLSGVCCAAAAQSSTTMYGVADAAMVYSSNQNGGSNTYMRSGNLASSRLGFKGGEDLGGGTQVIYVLEAGFNLDDGSSSSSGSLFNRQAYIGLSNARAGTLTVGRQYTPYYLFVGPVGPVGALTGATGAHPGDIDGLDVTIRTSNSLSYASPVWRGAQLGVLAASGEQADHNGSAGTLSAALKYDVDAWNFALGYQVLRNGPQQTTWDPAASGSFSKSAINAGYLSAESVQYLAAAARYQLGSVSLGGVVSNVQYRPNSSSLFDGTAIFNTAGVHASWATSTPWVLSAGYSYTRENQANGITDPANYRQLSLEQAYNLSKRTAIYFLEATQQARGKTLGANGIGAVDAVAVVGDSQTGTASSTGRQNVFMLGLRHSF